MWPIACKSSGRDGAVAAPPPFPFIPSPKPTPLPDAVHHHRTVKLVRFCYIVLVTLKPVKHNIFSFANIYFLVLGLSILQPNCLCMFLYVFLSIIFCYIELVTLKPIKRYICSFANIYF